MADTDGIMELQRLLIRDGINCTLYIEQLVSLKGHFLAMVRYWQACRVPRAACRSVEARLGIDALAGLFDDALNGTP